VLLNGRHDPAIATSPFNVHSKHDDTTLRHVHHSTIHSAQPSEDCRRRCLPLLAAPCALRCILATVFWPFAVCSHSINTFLTELLRGGCSSALRACHQRAGQHRQCQRLRCSMCQMTAVLRHRSTRVCFDQSARHSLQVSFGDHVMQVRSFANWRDRNTLFCNEMKAKKKTNCISRVFAMC
jgi:hypothetical protein